MTRNQITAVFVAVAMIHCAADKAHARGDRPNVVWLTSEDNSPFLGCYGDKVARTPNLDALATEGVLYENAFANAPICAPARSTLITGCYACSLGTQPMRSGNRIPPTIIAYSKYLRDAGYYCTNRSKTDYNTKLDTRAIWDECSGRGHWKNRKPGQPFFAIFNLTTSHESRVHPVAGNTTTRPADITLPPYHPDTPTMRKQWALYYDKVSEMDGQMGGLIRELKDGGLWDDTIVFYYADHGGVLPRSKRFLFDSGTRVPLIIYCPAKYRHLVQDKPGTRTDRLVSFVDFGPTLLSLCGIEPPKQMQGEAFLGKYAKSPRDYVYFFRDRADERPDMFRAVCDKRYRYIRNYYPHLPYGQHLNYLWKNIATREWEQLFRAGKLNATRSRFFMPRSAEELYDMKADPHNVKNLAGDPALGATLDRLRGALRSWQLEIRDTGFLPEAEMMERAADSTIYQMARDPSKYDLERLMEAAEVSSARDAANISKLRKMLEDSDSGIRFWGATGLLALGTKARPATDSIRAALKDSAVCVRVQAAHLLCIMDRCDEALPVLEKALHHQNQMASLLAANAIDYLDDRAMPLLKKLIAASGGGKSGKKGKKRGKNFGKFSGYPARVLMFIAEEMKN